MHLVQPWPFSLIRILANRFGVDALEGLGLELDPVTKELRKPKRFWRFETDSGLVPLIITQRTVRLQFPA
jgi:hypothetical protein